MKQLSDFFTDNKDVLTILIAIVAGLIGFATFIKAIFEYRLQGRQKRAELLDLLRNRLWTDQQLSRVTRILEGDQEEFKRISKMDKYYFLGFYEQVAIAVNSGLIRKNVAHYFFGYFARRCGESENFWYKDESSTINKNSYHWMAFRKFVEKMRKIEKNRTKPNFIRRLYVKIHYRQLYTF